MDLTLKLIIGIFLTPLSVSVILFLLRKMVSQNTIAILTVTGSFLTFILCLILSLNNFNVLPSHYSYNWINFNGIKLSVGVFADNISMIMLVLVSGISLLVQIFSVEYMKGDAGYGRYFACLSFFTFSMLGILVAPNLLMIFIFWELVGFSSYMLIGFWYSKDSAAQASKKAFIVNRIGDIGFLLGILIFWALFRTLDLKELSVLINDSYSLSKSLIFLAGLGLFAGCVGKSAQFPLQIWLPDAMEGPTPVSALIHAATMVAAGVFLLAKVFFILNLEVMTVIAFVGTITAFMGAIAALEQYDIKKVLAFSTISQLGYMVMAMGIGAYQASLFHLITHAFFKAGLFLCAGAVIHALHQAAHHHSKDFHFDAQDMRLMGGLRKKIPVTFAIYCITAAALVGIPFTSGFLSKDAIVVNSIVWAGIMENQIGPVAFIVPLLALITVFLTAFYMGRQIIMIFFGEFRLNALIPNPSDFKIKKESLYITLPLVVLGLFSLFFVFSVNPLNPSNAFLFKSLAADLNQSSVGIFQDKNYLINELKKGTAAYHTIALIMSIILVIAGITFAVKKYYKRELAFDKNEGIIANLSLNNWYLDRIYEKSIVRLLNFSSALTDKIDRMIIDPFLHFLGYFTVIFSLIIKVIDKLLVDGLVNSSVYITGRIGIIARSFQGGKVQYLFIIVILSLMVLIYLTAF